MEQAIKNKFIQFKKKGNLRGLNTKTFSGLRSEFSLTEDQVYFFNNHKQLFSDLWENQSESSSLESRKKISSSNRTETQFYKLKDTLEEKHRQGKYPEKNFEDTKYYRFYHPSIDTGRKDKEGDTIFDEPQIIIDEEDQNTKSRISGNNISHNGTNYEIQTHKGYVKEVEYNDDRDGELKPLIDAYRHVMNKNSFKENPFRYFASFVPTVHWDQVKAQFMNPS